MINLNQKNKLLLKNLDNLKKIYDFIMMQKLTSVIIFFYNRPYFFFILYLFIGLLIFKDYGVSTDEELHRRLGIYWYNYIFDNFFPNLIKFNFFIPNDPTVDDPLRLLFYGVVFDLPLAFLESIFLLKNTQSYIYLRHFFNFFIFFISSFFLFKLIAFRFKKKYYGYIGVLFYILSPRIFAESFYNNKDIIFLSIYVIVISQIFFFFKEKNYLKIFFISLSTAILFCVRPVAVILIFLFIIYSIIDLFNKKKFLKNFYFLLIFVVFFIFFIFFFLPFFFYYFLYYFLNFFFFFY